jgi:hypothetical protein
VNQECNVEFKYNINIGSRAEENHWNLNLTCRSQISWTHTRLTTFSKLPVTQTREVCIIYMRTDFTSNVHRVVFHMFCLLDLRRIFYLM